MSISIPLSKTMNIKSCIASQANGIRIAISGWGKINIEPLREHPKGLLSNKSIHYERFNNQFNCKKILKKELKNFENN